MKDSAQITGRISIARELRMIAVAGILLLLAAAAVTALNVINDQKQEPVARVTQNQVA